MYVNSKQVETHKHDTPFLSCFLHQRIRNIMFRILEILLYSGFIAGLKIYVSKLIFRHP